MIHLLLSLSLIALQPLVSHVPYSHPGPSWIDPDIVIDSAYDYQAISVATRRSTGEIFVAASRCEGAGENYKLLIWSSPDGINWSEYMNIGSPGASFSNPSMNIFTTADSEYIVMAYELQDTLTDERNLRALHKPFGGIATYWNISANPGIDERNPDLCNIDLLFPNDPLLYCTFESGDSICFVRSTDYGKTWSQRMIIGPGSATGDNRNPDCAFGFYSSLDSTFVGVAWQYVGSDGSSEIRFRENTLNGLAAHWRPVHEFPAPINKQDFSPCLQMALGYPSAVIMYVRKDTVGTDNADLYRYLTNDGASTWHDQTQYNSGAMELNVPHGLAVDDTLGYYHLVYRDQSSNLRYHKARYDSTWAGWSSSMYLSNGNGYNDWDEPAVGVRNGQPYVCWADYHPPVYKLKFDAEWLTGIEENPDKIRATSGISLTPNPSRGSFKIFYNVTKPGPVRIALYDISGRLVRNLVAETKSAGAYVIEKSKMDLASGIYLIRLETADNLTTAKPITIIR